MSKASRSPFRIVLVCVGWLLMLLSPIVGAIPGPGFIILFPLGLALVLKNSLWAKRLYVRFERRFPDYGRWSDWALRRRRSQKPDLPGFRDTMRRAFCRVFKSSRNT